MTLLNYNTVNSKYFSYYKYSEMSCNLNELKIKNAKIIFCIYNRLLHRLLNKYKLSSTILDKNLFKALSLSQNTKLIQKTLHNRR